MVMNCVKDVFPVLLYKGVPKESLRKIIRAVASEETKETNVTSRPKSLIHNFTEIQQNFSQPFLIDNFNLTRKQKSFHQDLIRHFGHTNIQRSLGTIKPNPSNKESPYTEPTNKESPKSVLPVKKNKTPNRESSICITITLKDALENTIRTAAQTCSNFKVPQETVKSYWPAYEKTAELNKAKEIRKTGNRKSEFEMQPSSRGKPNTENSIVFANSKDNKCEFQNYMPAAPSPYNAQNDPFKKYGEMKPIDYSGIDYFRKEIKIGDAKILDYLNRPRIKDIRIKDFKDKKVNLGKPLSRTSTDVWNYTTDDDNNRDDNKLPFWEPDSKKRSYFVSKNKNSVSLYEFLQTKSSFKNSLTLKQEQKKGVSENTRIIETPPLRYIYNDRGNEEFDEKTNNQLTISPGKLFKPIDQELPKKQVDFSMRYDTFSDSLPRKFKNSFFIKNVKQKTTTSESAFKIKPNEVPENNLLKKNVKKPKVKLSFKQKSDSRLENTKLVPTAAETILSKLGVERKNNFIRYKPKLTREPKIVILKTLVKDNSKHLKKKLSLIQRKESDYTKPLAESFSDHYWKIENRQSKNLKKNKYARGVY